MDYRPDKVELEVKNELSAAEAKGLLATFDDDAKVTWTLPEQIANQLSEDIILGKFVPGQQLMETMLAENYFQVSRGPVREALRLLEYQGLVQIRPRRGVVVRELTAADIKEIFDVRAVLQGLVASELANLRTDAVLAKLHKGTRTITLALEQNNADEFVFLLYRLSMYLAKEGGNSYARKVLVSLGRQTLVTTRKVMLIEENSRTWVDNWIAIVKAIEDSDPVAAEAAARKMVYDVYDGTVELLNSRSADVMQAEEQSQSLQEC